MLDDAVDLIDHLRPTAAYRKLTPEGIALLHQMCAGEPVRTVGAGALTSVSGEFPSKKLGKRFSLQFESVSGERFFTLLNQIDPETLLLLDQPTRLRVRAHDIHGRRSWRKVTPDHLLCRHDVFCFVEVKHLKELKKKAKEYPADWVKDENGGWHFLPAEEVANAMGFGHRVFVPDEYSKAFQTNALWRWRVWEVGPPRLSPRVLAKLRLRLGECPLTVRRLCETNGKITGGQLLQAVERGELYGLLDRQIFDDDFLIFGAEEEVIRHRKTIEASLAPKQAVGPMLDRMMRASVSEHEQARKCREKYETDRLNGVPLNATAYRQQKRMREAMKEGAPCIAAFILNLRGRGGKGRPISDVIRESIESAVRKFMKKERGRRTPRRAMKFWEEKYPQYKGQISEETFRKNYHRTNAPEKIALFASGIRGFHQARPRTDGRDMNPRAAIVGLDAHLDGVYGDALAVSELEHEFERPIYYPMIDGVTGYVFGRGVQTNRPSSLAVNMALGDCVARHGFLPSVITRDCGSENRNSTSPQRVVGLDCIFQYRPSAGSRYGGVIEGFNSHFNAYMETLDGGTRYDAAGRSADGNKKGRKHARYTMAEMIRKGDRWIFEVWNKANEKDSPLSREEMTYASLQRFPEAVVKWQDGPLLRYHTGYPLQGKKFSYTRGFRYGGRSFSSVELSTAIRSRKKLTDPRLDSMDPSVVWVCHEGQYIAAFSQEHARVAGMDIGQRVALFYEMANFQKQSKVNGRNRRWREIAEDMLPEPIAAPASEGAARPVPNAIASALSSAGALQSKPKIQRWPKKRVRVPRLGEP